MTSLAEIEAAIAKLPEDEARQLADWLQDYLDERWDQQIASDVAAGKLDHLIQQAKSDIAAGQVRDLDEVLHNT
ncbi:hypothetical protein K9N68_18010 [Kovacikia minuta CCNUW1]|uniref:hypothetical protein n=1 Tax=Kovacikia minuta TaxID=2931930 RepID=UPI001CCF7887|nr:hypothetical protein [Kovacikia minuta]UBF23667.1 hypothetical protein K9N68_18010 [Kovacikia minuta CCNUW1]